MSSTSASTSRAKPSLTNIYAKQKKDDVVDIIFDEGAALDLLDLISDFIADRFNHLPTLFTVLQLRCVCNRVRQLSTNALVESVLTKLKYKPSQNQAKLCDLSKSMERIRKEKLIKGRSPTIKITPEKEKVDIEIVEEAEEDESSK
jgi:hypothetical protein